VLDDRRNDAFRVVGALIASAFRMLGGRLVGSPCPGGRTEEPASGTGAAAFGPAARASPAGAGRTAPAISSALVTPDCGPQPDTAASKLGRDSSTPRRRWSNDHRIVFVSLAIAMDALKVN
jgi:hypothetical protein